MKHNHIVSLLQENYQTVAVNFWQDGPGASPIPQSKQYTYKVLKDWNVRVGEDLVVIVKDIPKVVRVVEVHLEPAINLDADYDYRWAACKLDYTEYHIQMEKEQTALRLLRDAERQKQRRALLAEINQSLASEELQLLSATLNANKPTE